MMVATFKDPADLNSASHLRTYSRFVTVIWLFAAQALVILALLAHFFA
jgi:hypothetical protein